MDPQTILTADPLDLLFDNRNKSYGAYPLRKFYDRRMLIGLGFSLSAGVIFFSVLLFGHGPVIAKPSFDGPVVIIQPPPDMRLVKPKEIVPVRRVQPVATVANPVFRIVPDQEVTKPLHPVEDLMKGRIGVTDIPGPAESGVHPAGAETSGGSETAMPVKEAAPEVYRHADVMPQFPGGQEALLRFLNRNLRMPDGAEPGTHVSVLATFVVGGDGKVKQTEMSRSGGERFDAEVKRVLAKMPAWIPGRVGDRAVAVYFTLPVQFVVPEE